MKTADTAGGNPYAVVYYVARALAMHLPKARKAKYMAQRWKPARGGLNSLRLMKIKKLPR